MRKIIIRLLQSATRKATEAQKKEVIRRNRENVWNCPSVWQCQL